MNAPMWTARLLLVALSAGVLPAQLLPEQREFDFQNLAAMFAKRYAPYDWKRLALGFDLHEIKPWMDRVRAAKDDLEFFEIEAEYVASLQDTHTGFSMTSSFSANLGITVDIYDGKVLIDSINRSLLPQSQFPFAMGDELVSVDGVSAEDWITLLSKWRAYGNPATTRRVAAGKITVRSQSGYPRAVEIGDSATVVINRWDPYHDTWNLETYSIPWTKSGLPVYQVGPSPMPQSATAKLKAAAVDPVAPMVEFQNWKLTDSDPLFQTIDWAVDPDGQPRRFTSGQGSRAPIFAVGLSFYPFMQRLGKASSNDFHYSGTYQAGGKTIGYLRIPGFAPPSTLSAIRELDAEIDYMQRTTDGLVIDVMRNSGGGCYMLDVAARLIPYPFYFFGEEIRATQDRLNSMKSMLDSYKSASAPGWAIAVYQGYIDEMKQALAEGRRTWPIPACSQYGSNMPPGLEGNQPAAVVYTKPMIVLVDEFSISAADIFPSMIQDNGRAPLVGMRTSGGGGSVSSWPTGMYSESISGNTNTLVVRRNPVTTPDLPAAPYVENIGARPDIPLDYMTRENLLYSGKSFVDQFTSIILDQIQKSK